MKWCSTDSGAQLIELVFKSPLSQFCDTLIKNIVWLFKNEEGKTWWWINNNFNGFQWKSQRWTVVDKQFLYYLWWSRTWYGPGISDSEDWLKFWSMTVLKFFWLLVNISLMVVLHNRKIVRISEISATIYTIWFQCKV